MGKNKNFILYLFCIIFCIGTFILYKDLKKSISSATIVEKIDTVYLKPDTVFFKPKVVVKKDTVYLAIKANSTDLRGAILKTIRNEIGVKELTGKNDGVRVGVYQKAAKLKQGDEWCAAFVCWVYTTNGVKVPISGWSPSWFPKDKVIWSIGGVRKEIPLPGDVGGIYIQSKGRIGHTVTIEDWGTGNSVTTIDGNYQNQVMRVYRLKSQISKVSKWL